MGAELVRFHDRGIICERGQCRHHHAARVCGAADAHCNIVGESFKNSVRDSFLLGYDVSQLLTYCVILDLAIILGFGFSQHFAVVLARGLTVDIAFADTNADALDISNWMRRRMAVLWTVPRHHMRLLDALPICVGDEHPRHHKNAVRNGIHNGLTLDVTERLALALSVHCSVLFDKLRCTGQWRSVLCVRWDAISNALDVVHQNGYGHANCHEHAHR